MREFVADDVERNGEAVEKLLVAIAVDHLLAVPEGVIVLHAIVHAGIEAETFVVDGVAVENGFVEVVGLSGVVVGFIHRDVGAGGSAFGAHQLSGQVFAVLFIVNRAAEHACGYSGVLRTENGAAPARTLGERNGVQGPVTKFLRFCQLLENVRRQYGAEEVPGFTHVYPPISGFWRWERPAGHLKG